MNNEKLRADIKSALNGMPLAAMGTYAELLNRAYAALGEIDRLRSELGKANSQTAHFEREWYLRGDEIEALTAKLGEQASVPEWWKIERSFDVLPRPCVDGKSHQPTIKIVLPACAPDDMDAFDVRDQIAETVRKLLYAAPSAPAAPEVKP